MKETINIEIDNQNTMKVDIKATVMSLGIAIISLTKTYHEKADGAEWFAFSNTLLDVLKGR